MLVSHRHHAPIAGACIELDRVLAPTWIARRVRLEGVAQDEHVTNGIGKGTAGERARLLIMIEGRCEAKVGDRSYDLAEGNFLLVPCLAEVLTRSSGEEILEIDWNPAAVIASGPVTGIEHGKLSPRTLAAAAAMARALRDDGVAERLVAECEPGVLDAFGATMPDAVRALAAEGVPLDASAWALALVDGVDADGQRLFCAIDDTLTRIDGGPAVVELEAKLGWSRRTVSRRTAELHAHYGLSGIDGESWRSMRDFYRMLLGTIFASHPTLTTRKLASVLGYGSPDALCHAFANAGLPSPGAVKKFRR